ncbi:MAG: AsnC family transcriptional regulator [Cyanobacteria bacterium P01_D01_bin.56]
MVSNDLLPQTISGYDIDQLDLNIIKLLQHNGRIAYSDIARSIEWTEQFSKEISIAENEATDTSSYYERWVRACEKLLITKGILEPLAVEQRIEEILIERSVAKEHDHLDHESST